MDDPIVDDRTAVFLRSNMPRNIVPRNHYYVTARCSPVAELRKPQATMCYQYYTLKALESPPWGCFSIMQVFMLGNEARSDNGSFLTVITVVYYLRCCVMVVACLCEKVLVGILGVVEFFVTAVRHRVGGHSFFLFCMKGKQR